MRRLLSLLMFCAVPAAADVPRVATDIAPIHGLVSRVMEGVGTPTLVVPAGASPHDHAMRPSEARGLGQADLVVWVGHGLTPWLEGPIDSLSGSAQVIELMDVPGAKLLEMREGGVFEGHDHGHDHGHGHEGKEATDPHLWLDPVNAQLWLGVIAQELGTLDAENADTYQSNARAGVAEIEAASVQIADALAPLKDRRFVVLHDGFHYFEARFGIEATAAVSASDADAPGAARVSDLREHLREAGIDCAFSEPQMDARLLATVTEGLSVKSGVIDPLGADIPLGAGHYTALLMSISASLHDCLTP
jgi:zinc transport system substrate-binding protein